jgi:hypothetical protein
MSQSLFRSDEPVNRRPDEYVTIKAEDLAWETGRIVMGVKVQARLRIPWDGRVNGVENRRRATRALAQQLLEMIEGGAV